MWLLDRIELVGVGANGATVLSVDGGQTFPNVISSNLAFTLNPSGAGIVRGGAAPSAYIPDTGGHIAATTNSGAGWTLLRAPTSGAVQDVAFPTTSKGFELESDGTLRATSDGGVSWASLDTGVAKASALAATSARNVLLIGPRGISRSSDGGSIFNAVPGRVTIATKPKKTVSISKLALASSQTVGAAVVAWGGSGLFESTNQGGKWKIIPSPLPRGHLVSVSFVSASTGYVMDNSQRIFYTRSTGRRWTRIETIGYPQLASLSFSSASTGMIALGVYSWSNAAFASVDVIATRKLSAKALGRAGNKVTIKGTLSPVTSVGEQVLLMYHGLANSWHRQLVTVASNGAFSAVVHGIKASTAFSAASVGNGLYGGAGTPVTTLRVSK